MKPPVIPDKLYFKIGEVSGLAGVEPYVLRYWETEFSDIAPLKSRTNQRLYKKKDVELVLKIKHLLYDERFTIDGARKRLKEESRRNKSAIADRGPQLGLHLDQPDQNVGDRFEPVKKEILGLLKEMERSVEE
ncbi:MAG: MerR family transcriptional regulator [Deltaproteobacteria bacterium]|nr:MerR family transcriptional regulator [Deltaproteobacteria bacterium]